MRILTLIRPVLDAEETVRIRGCEVDLNGSKLVVDTMDEYGVELVKNGDDPVVQ